MLRVLHALSDDGEVVAAADGNKKVDVCGAVGRADVRMARRRVQFTEQQATEFGRAPDNRNREDNNRFAMSRSDGCLAFPEQIEVH